MPELAEMRAATLVLPEAPQERGSARVDGELRQLRELCTSLLDQIRVPAIVTTSTGALERANEAAEAMLLCYRVSPHLWDEYGAAVHRNASGLAANGNDGGGTIASRRGDEITYLVRTNTVPRSGRLLSLFHPCTGNLSARGALGAREQVIACLVAQGHTNDRIATTLDLSVNTVKDHMKRINRKLGTSNRAQVAAWAQRHLALAPGARS